MKVLIVDDQQKRASQILDVVKSRKLDALWCSSSGDFIDAVQAGNVKAIVLDVETWHRGRSIYGYIGLVRKLEKTPIIFFNAPEGFTALADRARLDKDAILPVSAPVDAIAESLAVVA